MRSLLTTAVALLSLAVLVSSAQASAKDFDVKPVTYYNSTNVQTGKDQFKIEVIDSGTRVGVKIKNTGSAKSTITGIYFDDHASDDFQSVYSIVNAPSVSFSMASPPTALPDGLSDIAGFVATDVFIANNQQEKKGVTPGRYVTMNFNLASGATWQDVMDDLANGSLLVGISSCFEDNTAARESFATMPEPATIVIMAMGFMGLPLAAKRR